MPELKVLESGQEMTYPVGADPMVVGRADDVDVALLEVRASRRHCVLEPGSQGVKIRDLGSANGTKVNGERILQKALRHGDEIAIGEVRIRFEADAPPAHRGPAVPRRRRARGAAVLLLPVILLGFALLVLAALSGQRDDEIAAARESIAESRLNDILLVGDSERRVDAIEAWLDAHPESRHVERAREELVSIRDRVDRRRKGEEAFRAVENQARDLAPEELAYRYANLLKRYGDLPGYADRVNIRLGRLTRTRRVAAEVALIETRETAGRALAEEDFATAVAALDSFEASHPGLAADFKAEVTREAGRVLARAALASRALEARADAMRADGRLDEAESVLATRLDRFAGTRHADDLRLKIEALRTLRDAGSVPGSGRSRAAEAAAGATSRERRQAYLDAREAEDLARAGLYHRAIEAYGRILEGVKDARIRGEFAGRMDDLVRVRDLVQRVRETARGEPKKFKTVRLGQIRGRVVGGNENEILIESRGAVLKRPWLELDVAAMTSLCRALKLDSKGLLALAVLQYDQGDQDAWVATLIEAMEDEGLKETIDAVFARKEGLNAPAGGFVAYQGRILTRDAYDRERREEEIATLLQRFSDDLNKLDAQPLFKLVARMRDKRGALEAARKHAFDLILDTKTYFYPYRDRVAEYTPVQQEVNKRVGVVRQAWDDPAKIALRRTPETTKLLERLEETRQTLVNEFAYDAAPLRNAITTRSLYLQEPPRAVTIRTFPTSPGDDRRIAYDHRVLKYNETLGGAADGSEAEQVRITNEYRMMMGRAAVVRDDRLVLAARKHCEEMGRLGYFGHFSPIPERRDPMKRVRLEGYKGMPVSENCHRGSSGPAGAHHGWTQSSGHHRNLLGRSWTDMGTGRSGNIWTQNFGRTKPLPEKKGGEETPPPK